MLKLEKCSDSNIRIRIRKQESFFEPPLLKALGIALLLHMGALTLFHVTPFSFYSTFTFPPVHVQSDVSIKGVSAQVYRPSMQDDMLPPPLTFIPPLDWISFSSESPLAPLTSFDPQDFQTLEQQIWPKWQEPLLTKLEEPRIQLTISGDLANIPLARRDSLLNQMQPLSSHDSAAYVTYQAQLDERTGEIFWYERIESSGVKAIDQCTENILLNLRFTPPNNQIPILGTLTFVVLPESNGRQEIR